jgi:TrmH family RNA methyltransferase
MISKSQISFIKSLHQKKYRREHQQFIIEGDKLLREFLASHYQLLKIFVLDTYYDECMSHLSKVSKKIDIEIIKAEEMQRISTFANSSECLATVEIPKELDKDELSANFIQNNLVLALDGVRDPGNLGTIIRIADWFGIQHIICSDDSVELYNPKVVQSTMGSILRVKVQYVDLHEFLNTHKTQNIWGALLKGADIYTVNEPKKGILLMGSESHGIHIDNIKYINKPITIPNFGGSAESLNVAVATAILCSEFVGRA